MSKLVVAAVGPATSVQDAGRHGAQRYGLTPSGAMDTLALAAANALLGNAPFAAAIELGPLGSAFIARGGPVRIALTGAPRPAAVDGRPIALNESLTLAEGERLTLGVARGGVFGYLAIERGIQGEPMFGSLAVNARAGLGSPFPRPLQVGDEIRAIAASGAPERRIDLPPEAEAPIRVVLGPQHDEFTDDAVKLFLDSEWRISATSDRMGYRLEGPAIKHLHGHNIVSDGTVNGSIQVPGNGQPIVLMPDRGTSGGYPKIATVITVDLRRLAQTQAGRGFRFEAVTMAQAQDAYRALAQAIRALPGRVVDAQASQLDLDALHSANVAGVATNAFDG
ncbi:MULTISPECIES: biotin-dependent carboxyltransferase family protein [Rhodopseudomonas]|uniref:Allophanate hydrolase n=1 Tax=Rhodopseudomonas palustris TaxID=1076 RepID=A0A0D7EXG5_RHOPL|nr:MULTISPECIES: biotin-dependent carboxyltransferase family protein [Rhodopseudomonas]KIZ45508.1 allophanate hydrolase [Rhodopseudomonas palustris]MDF3814439.1 biotin-dependent carboxyltransferase family protein [Rhodopseudomonas sp. BAL398]WOK18897.1 biotin-dependent carboxyltransferase family protein [Rhodopseudomonas sp. BAL398]